MNIVADESVDAPIIAHLRLDGHLITAIAESHASIADPEVLRIANESQSLLLTSDKDFGELVFRMKMVHHGVVLLRLAGLSNNQKATLVVRVFRDPSELPGAFTVIAPGIIRRRKG